jgi:acetyltransferase
VWLSEWLEGPGIQGYESLERVALFRSTGRCFAAIAAWHAHHDMAALAEKQAPRLAAAGARDAARALLAAAGDTLTEREAKHALAAYGVPVSRRSSHERRGSALRHAPLATRSRSIVERRRPHKTEAGVVRLAIADGVALRRAFDEVMAAARRAARGEIRGVLVQPMAPGVRSLSAPAWTRWSARDRGGPGGVGRSDEG